MSLGAALAVMLLQHRCEHRALDDRHSEGLRHTLHGDVVVRRTDAARGEQPVVRGSQRTDFVRDHVDVVGDHHDAPQLDPELPKRARQRLDVRLRDLAGEELVADDERGGGRGDVSCAG